MRAILRDEIVHPLRKHHFVRADRVLKLRVLLENISKMTGLTNEEKDPEEFMNILMAQTLRAEPYLKVYKTLFIFLYICEVESIFSFFFFTFTSLILVRTPFTINYLWRKMTI